MLVTKAKEMGIIQPGRRGRKKSSALKIFDKMKHLADTLREHKASLIFCKGAISRS